MLDKLLKSGTGSLIGIASFTAAYCAAASIHGYTVNIDWRWFAECVGYATAGCLVVELGNDMIREYLYGTNKKKEDSKVNLYVRDGNVTGR